MVIRLYNLFKKNFKVLIYGIYNSIIVKDYRIIFSCSITFPLPKSIKMPHPIGIVIGKGSKIGKNCIIMQNVTIGIRKLGENKSPTLEDNVFIGPGSVILGNITIGAGSIIGSNKVIIKSIPKNSKIV